MNLKMKAFFWLVLFSCLIILPAYSSSIINTVQFELTKIEGVSPPPSFIEWPAGTKIEDKKYLLKLLKAFVYTNDTSGLGLIFNDKERRHALTITLLNIDKINTVATTKGKTVTYSVTHKPLPLVFTREDYRDCPSFPIVGLLLEKGTYVNERNYLDTFAGEEFTINVKKLSIVKNKLTMVGDFTGKNTYYHNIKGEFSVNNFPLTPQISY